MDKVNSVMYYNMDELGRLDAKSQRREQSLNIPISTLIQAKKSPFTTGQEIIAQRAMSAYCFDH